MTRTGPLVLLMMSIALSNLFDHVVCADPFSPTVRIPLGVHVVQIHEDPSRDLVYAIDRGHNQVLFIDLKTMSVTNSLYVGLDPTSFDVDQRGNNLYVANKGVGTGLPGSYRITVVDLNTQTVAKNHTIPAFYVNKSLLRAVNVTAGCQDRLYYNASFDLWNGGMARVMNADTGEDLGAIAGIKTMMVISSDKSRLYGQYVYEGNLGQMGVWDVSTDVISQSDSCPYSPYPYGWDYDNYSISGDDRYLAYGQILFNSTNLSHQYGVFAEQVYALNHDGSIAYGTASIWDTTTFATCGHATEVQDMPFSSRVMKVDQNRGILYAFNENDLCLYAIERTTSNGISHRWLSSYGLDTNSTVETQDPDTDGYTTLQEWMLDSDPTNRSSGFAFINIHKRHLTVAPTSCRRWYALEGTTNLLAGNWLPVTKTNGAAGQLTFDCLSDSNAFYRVNVSVD